MNTRRSRLRINPNLPRLPHELDFAAWEKYIPQENRAIIKKRILAAHAIGKHAYPVYEAKRSWLEALHWGKYVYISVDAGKVLVRRSPTRAIKDGNAKFGDKESYTVQIGRFERPQT